MKAKLSAPMPFSAASRMVSRRLHATHSGGCGFCTGLGTTLRGGICTNWPSTPVNGVSVMQRMATSRPSSHGLALGRRVDAEAAELGLRAGLARAELDPAVRHQVERGDALGRAGRVVVAGRGLDDAVAEADVRGALAAAARKTSGADECEYSSRKWCSTSHTYWKPSWSASSTWSRASWISCCSCRRPTAAAAGARRRCRTSCVPPDPLGRRVCSDLAEHGVGGRVDHGAVGHADRRSPG